MNKCTVFYCIFPYMYLIYQNGYNITITTKFNDHDLISKIDSGEIFGFLKLNNKDFVYILLHKTPDIFINNVTAFDLFEMTNNDNFNMILSMSITPLAQFPDILDICTSEFDIIYIKKYPNILTNVTYFESELAFCSFLDYFFIKTYKCAHIDGGIRLFYSVDIKFNDLFYFLQNKNVYIVGENTLGTYRKGVFNLKTLDCLNNLLLGDDISNYSSNITHQNEIIFIDAYPLYKWTL